MLVFFLFEQKTAYEMRISDWSSDVCSSDLSALVGFNIIDRVLNGPDLFRCVVRNFHAEFFFESHDQLDNVEAVSAQIVDEARLFVHLFGFDAQMFKDDFLRSEEHTSELQSLMRNSYAVFCLNKKNKHK